MEEKERLAPVEHWLFPAVMTALALVLLFHMLRLVSLEVEPRWNFGVLFALPAAAFGAVTWATARGKLREKTSLIVTALLIAVSLAELFFSMMAFAFNSAVEPVTDPKYYPRAVEQVTHKLTTAFPDEVPEGARDVSFTYNTPFLQGGTLLRLGYTADTSDIQSAVAGFGDKVIWTGTINDTEADAYFLDAFNDLPVGMEEDAVFYAFYGKPSQPHDWNHGQRSMAIVNAEETEIVYQAESW